MFSKLITIFPAISEKKLSEIRASKNPALITSASDNWDINLPYASYAPYQGSISVDPVLERPNRVSENDISHKRTVRTRTDLRIKIFSMYPLNPTELPYI